MLTHTESQECTAVAFGSMVDDRLLRRVRGEFNEMPGMRLTVDQAMRLWSLDRAACAGVLDALVATHFLVQDAYGRYRRVDAGY